MFLIYRIRNMVNGKEYIGQTIEALDQRKRRHLKDSRRYDYPLYRAIRKYGAKWFEFSEICRCESRKQLDEVEIFCIRYFNSRVPSGYNVTKGGGGILGLVHSEETKARLREINLGKKASEEKLRKMRGRKQSAETIAKRSASMVGHITTDETRRKISVAQIGKKRNPKSIMKMRLTKLHQGNHLTEEQKEHLRIVFKGRKFTDDWKAKISESLKGRIVSEDTRQKLRLANLGKKASEETKAKMRTAQKGRKHNEESKALIKASWIIRKQNRRPHAQSTKERTVASG